MSHYAYRPKRRDANEPAIVAALERCGCLVQRLDGLGLPDLLVMRAERLFLMEIKVSAREAKRVSETAKRQASFRRRGWPVHVVLSPIDALRVVGLSSPQEQAERMGRTARAVIDAQLRDLEAM